MAETFHSDLAERLLRRATERVGVVDVRRSQERYARAAAWPRQHVALLERSAARAQVEPPPDQGMALLLAARTADSSVLHEMVARQAGMTEVRPPLLQAPAIAPHASAAASPHSTSDGAMRNGTTSREFVVGPPMRAVSRTGADPFQPSRSPVARSTAADGSDRVGPPSESTMRTMPARTGSADGAAATSLDAAAVPSADGPPRAVSIQEPQAPPSSHVFVQRRIGAKRQPSDASDPIVNPARGVRVRPPGSQPDAHTPGPDAAVVTRVPPVVQAQAVARAAAVDAGRFSGAEFATLPLRVGVATTGPTRASAVPADPASHKPRSTAAPPVPTAAFAAGAAPSPMVWRRGADASAPRSASTTGTAPAVGADAVRSGERLDAFHAGSITSAQEAFAASASPAPSGLGTGEGLDLERVVDEVTRRIVDRGHIQRGRRGGL